MNQSHQSTTLNLLTWNVANPSQERAERQLEWLSERPEDILVLTETRAGQGSVLLANRFTDAGYEVAYQVPEGTESGVMIASKVRTISGAWARPISFLPARAASVRLLQDPPLEVIALYVPSRDASERKTARKLDFVKKCLGAFDAWADHECHLILLGDLNILEPDHTPHYSFFAQWEYDFYSRLADFSMVDAFRHVRGAVAEHSWVGRTGDGYRYDHAFISRGLLDSVVDCSYLHEVRRPGLSDHSALRLSIRVPSKVPLPVSDLGPPVLTLF